MSTGASLGRSLFIINLRERIGEETLPCAPQWCRPSVRGPCLATHGDGVKFIEVGDKLVCEKRVDWDISSI